MNYLSYIASAVLSFFAPLIAFAADTGVTGAGTLKNPLSGIDDLDTLAVRILEVVVQVGAYVAVLFIIWSGFKFVAARGNPTKLEEAKKTLVYTLIGVAILLAAQAIAMGISATIKSVVG